MIIIITTIITTRITVTTFYTVLHKIKWYHVSYHIMMNWYDTIWYNTMTSWHDVIGCDLSWYWYHTMHYAKKNKNKLKKR